MNTPVSFEIAKLLKEKGVVIKPLNLKCETDYVEGYNWDLEDEKDSLKIKEFQFEDNNCSHLYLKPTIAEVVMRLYDKHGIWIFADRTNKWFWTIQKPNNEYIHQENLPITEKSIYYGFNSPAEAYEAAIEYVLNNLI